MRDYTSVPFGNVTSTNGQTSLHGKICPYSCDMDAKVTGDTIRKMTVIHGRRTLICLVVRGSIKTENFFRPGCTRPVAVRYFCTRYMISVCSISLIRELIECRTNHILVIELVLIHYTYGEQVTFFAICILNVCLLLLLLINLILPCSNNIWHNSINE